jgi:hypothetical protein
MSEQPATENVPTTDEPLDPLNQPAAGGTDDGEAGAGRRGARQPLAGAAVPEPSGELGPQHVVGRLRVVRVVHGVDQVAGLTASSAVHSALVTCASGTVAARALTNGR